MRTGKRRRASEAGEASAAGEAGEAGAASAASGASQPGSGHPGDALPDSVQPDAQTVMHVQIRPDGRREPRAGGARIRQEPGPRRRSARLSGQSRKQVKLEGVEPARPAGHLAHALGRDGARDDGVQVKLEGDASTELTDGLLGKNRLESRRPPGGAPGPQVEVKVKGEPDLDLGQSVSALEPGRPNVFRLAPDAPGPPGWTAIYNAVVAMRALVVAPVDTMGCERIPEALGDAAAAPREFRFRLLVLLMLSLQTRDEVTHAAVRRLHQHCLAQGYARGLSLEAVLRTPEHTVDALVSKVGFHTRKASYLKRTCLLLQLQFGGEVPRTIADVVSLPGVGPKMGYLLLQRAWGLCDGIGVDVHLHRLAVMWRWAPGSKSPEQTRVALERWLPPALWAEVNPLLVGFGQTVCPPQGRKCDICRLAPQCGGASPQVLKLRGDPRRRAELQRARGDLSLLIDW